MMLRVAMNIIDKAGKVIIIIYHYSPERRFKYSSIHMMHYIIRICISNAHIPKLIGYC